MSKETDLAWLAGFFEGEGCILLYQDRCSVVMGTVSVCQKEIFPLKKVLDICKAEGLPSPNINRNNNTVALIWTNFRGTCFLEALLPFFGDSRQSRRAKFYCVCFTEQRFSGQRLSPEEKGKRVGFYEEYLRVNSDEGTSLPEDKINELKLYQERGR